MKSIKLRHAAALTLVGWYLMMPPPVPKGMDPNLLGVDPLWRWSTLASFDTAAECSDSQTKMMMITIPNSTQYSATARANMVKQFSASRCIEADDPRLLSPASGSPR